MGYSARKQLGLESDTITVKDGFGDEFTDIPEEKSGKVQDSTKVVEEVDIEDIDKEDWIAGDEDNGPVSKIGKALAPNMESLGTIIDSYVYTDQGIHELRVANESLINLFSLEQYIDDDNKELGKIALESIALSNGIGGSLSYSEEGVKSVISTIWDAITKFFSWIVEKVVAVAKWLGRLVGIKKKEFNETVNDLQNDINGVDKDVVETVAEAIDELVETETPSGPIKPGDVGKEKKKDEKESLEKVKVRMAEKDGAVKGFMKKFYRKHIGDRLDERHNKKVLAAQDKIINLTAKIQIAHDTIFSQRSLVYMSTRDKSLAAHVDDSYVSGLVSNINSLCKSAPGVYDNFSNIFTQDVPPEQAKQMMDAATSKGWMSFDQVAVPKGIEDMSTTKGHNVKDVMNIEETRIKFYDIRADKYKTISLYHGKISLQPGASEDLKQGIAKLSAGHDVEKDDKTTLGDYKLATDHILQKYNYSPERMKRPEFVSNFVSAIKTEIADMDKVEAMAKTLTNVSVLVNDLNIKVKNVKNNIQKIEKGTTTENMRNNINTWRPCISNYNSMVILYIRSIGNLVNHIAAAYGAYYAHMTDIINMASTYVAAIKEVEKVKKDLVALKDK